MGLDGSPASKEALRWAAGQAKMVGAELQAVTAWQQPVSYGYLPDYSDADFEADASKQLEQTLAEVLGADPAVAVTASVMDGHPAPVPIEAARGAELLVVGSHGHGRSSGYCWARSVSIVSSTHRVRSSWYVTARPEPWS